MCQFAIHTLTVSGGMLALSPIPGRYGCYKRDLALVRDWQPALVISMTTVDEMKGAAADSFFHDLQALGMRWIHLPIEDFGAPNQDIAQKWQSVSRSARDVLHSGGRILIHCRGGCGRSGMVALRLMIESGEEPDAALSRLRKSRPCAVETDAQLSWAVAGVQAC